MLGVVWARWVVGSLGLSDSFSWQSLLFGLILSLISLYCLVYPYGILVSMFCAGGLEEFSAFLPPFFLTGKLYIVFRRSLNVVWLTFKRPIGEGFDCLFSSL